MSTTTSDESIVAIYEQAAHAQAAVQELKAANVPSDAIEMHAEDGTGVGTGATATGGRGAGTGAAPASGGFWSSLFGGDTDDSDVYTRSVAAGATVVTVKAPAQYVERVTDILERHHPIDIDDRAASYGTSQTVPTAGLAAGAAPTPAARPATGAVPGDETIQLSEEQLRVGKRAVNRGTTRVRRYVVETPVEEQVRLHDERVTVERRPVTDGRPVTDADFTDRTIEASARSEEAVVSKTARVTEEIQLHKEATDRVETVRDTVRKQEADVQQVPGTGAAERTGASADMRPGSNPPGTAAGRATDRTLGTNVSGANPGGNVPDGTPGNPPGTAAGRATDRTLGTNVSGANPGGNAPDGTPGNPPGTAASRAVDNVLDTNISGANPSRK